MKVCLLYLASADYDLLTANSFSLKHIITMEELPIANPELLIQLITIKMPFGKYKGTILRYLPVSYLEWFSQKGFPAGKLGILLQTLYEIKLNGLENLLDGLKQSGY